jgi:hypothetical protein
MRNYISLFFLTAIFLTACGGDKPGKEIIDKREMISLLTDVIIIDGSLYNVTQQPDSLYKYGTGRYLALFKSYNTDSARFNKSFKYYTSKPEDLKDIFDQVLQNLKSKSDSLNKLQLKINALPQKQR